MSRASYSEKASKDLEDIWDYIAKDNIDAADRWTEHLRSVADRLENEQAFLRGRRREDVTDTDILCWSEGVYVIAYRIRFGHVEVARVLHGARDFSQIEWA